MCSRTDTKYNGCGYTLEIFKVACSGTLRGECDGTVTVSTIETPYAYNSCE